MDKQTSKLNSQQIREDLGLPETELGKALSEVLEALLEIGNSSEKE